VIVHFVDIVRIVDHNCLNWFFLTLILYEVKYSILKETTRVCNTNTPITGLICLVRKDNYRINRVTVVWLI
jgi:hypothetical protein